MGKVYYTTCCGATWRSLSLHSVKKWTIRSLMTKSGRGEGSILATSEVHTVVLPQILKSSEMLDYVIS